MRDVPIVMMVRVMSKLMGMMSDNSNACVTMVYGRQCELKKRRYGLRQGHWKLGSKKKEIRASVRDWRSEPN